MCPHLLDGAIFIAVLDDKVDVSIEVVVETREHVVVARQIRQHIRLIASSSSKKIAVPAIGSRLLWRIKRLIYPTKRCKIIRRYVSTYIRMEVSNEKS